MKCRSSIGEVPVKYRSCIGQVSVMYRSSIGHVSVEYRWSKTISVETFIGQLSADISADVSADMSTEVTHSTHDPFFYLFLLQDKKLSHEN